MSLSPDLARELGEDFGERTVFRLQRDDGGGGRFLRGAAFELIANPPDRFAALGFGSRRLVAVFRQQIENLRPEIQQLRLGIGAAAQFRGVELTDPMINVGLEFGGRVVGAGGQNEHHQQGGTHNAPLREAAGSANAERRYQF